MKNDILITSSGIIRNRSLPRSGIVDANSLYNDLFEDCIHNGIDLTWESLENEMNKRIERGEISVDDAQNEMEYAEFDSHVFLLGAWIKDKDGLYKIDQTGNSGDYALEYNTETGIVSVEWSKYTVWCGNTSPCYVMSDGSGPCGDLDSKGDAVLAYTLPEDMFNSEVNLQKCFLA